MDKGYSILMSVYKKEQPGHLKESIQSILSQTLKTDNFVLVCDGKLTKELEQIIKEFQENNPGIFSILRLERNRGLGIALQEGLPYCKHELVARMDSDDIAKPCRCEKQIEIFCTKQVDIVSGTIEEFNKVPGDRKIYKILPENQEEIIRYARTRNPFNHPAVMFRKTAVEAVNGYQPFYLLEDYYLWVRMLGNGARAYNIQENLLYMRVGEGMYNRRGGLKYFKSLCRLYHYMRKIHFCTIFDVIKIISGYFFMCILPGRVRERIYIRKLRRSKNRD
ncbi:MAG: glycosyltransferase [Lachnospiraceae bacterium]|nr:glycosyltransferase [Lachnospiraceae bacterium]